MLTNFQTVYKRLQRLKELEQIDFDDVAGSGMTKKELLVLRREKDKLVRTLGGIREMSKIPSAVWVVDTNKEHIAVGEARKLGIPVIAILDSNCDPDVVDFPIPGNDDAIRAVGLLTRVIADAVAEGLVARASGGTAEAVEPLAEWEAELLAAHQAEAVAEVVAVEAVAEAVVAEAVAEEAVAEAIVAEEIAEDAVVEAVVAEAVAEDAVVEALVAEEIAEEAVVEAEAGEIPVEDAEIAVEVAVADELVAEEAIVEAAVAEAVAEEAVVEADVAEAVAEEAVVEAVVADAVAEEAVEEAVLVEAVAIDVDAEAAAAAAVKAAE
jgi:small subunit ribosomal protein S2